MKKNETINEKLINATSSQTDIINEENKNKTEENTTKIKYILNQINKMRKDNPKKFTIIAIGCVVGLIFIILILNRIIKWCKSYKRKGYMSQIDSDVGMSNKISGTSDF